MVEGIANRKPKKDVCHFAIVLKVLFKKLYIVKGVEHKRRRNRMNSHKRRRGRKRL
jgi:hypothetical protein